MLEAASALGFRETISEIAAHGTEPFNDSTRGTLQEALKRRFYEFEGVQIRVVQRQADEPYSGLLDRFADAHDLMGPEDVYHDDVARASAAPGGTAPSSRSDYR